MAWAAPKWRRRKEERPGEIVAAAFGAFAAHGYAGARIEGIAAQAGVSKGAVYRYFDTKEALFRAVVTEVIRPNVHAILDRARGETGHFPTLARAVLPRFADLVTALPIGAVIRMVIGESRPFPEIARVWHDEVIQPALGLVTTLIAEAQARGEIRPGNPRIHAFSLIGPILLGVIWRETFTPVGGAAVDLPAVATQHVETVLAGMELP